MDSYINSVDFFKGNKPEDIAQQYGTPLYVYNEDILRSCMRTVKNIITKYPYTANFSIKANSNIHIIKLAIEEGLNCDAVSINEAKILLHAGQAKEKIFFVPNNVSEQELQEAINLGIMTALDSLDQLERYGKLNKGGRCAIRLNPGVGAGHHEKVITAGKNTKFAIAADDVDNAIALAAEYDLKIVGICQHVGSLFMDPTPFLQSVTNLLYMAKKFENLEFIDFGGGYGVPYHKLDDEKPFDMELCRTSLEPVLTEFVEKYGYAPLFKSEPGRYCVAESSVLLGKVHSTKQNAGVTYIGTDLGMNVLVRPSMYDSWHDLEVIRNGEDVDRDNLSEKTIIGNICESGDLLAKGRMLPDIKKGDVIAALDAGAYGYSMCSSYNSRPRPAEVLITSDGEVKLIRRAETVEDLLKFF